MSSRRSRRRSRLSLSLSFSRFFRRFGRSLFSLSVSLFLSVERSQRKMRLVWGRNRTRTQKRELINPKNAMVDASQGRARGRSTEKPAGKTRRRGTRWKERVFFARTVASRDDEGELFASGREIFCTSFLGVSRAPKRRQEGVQKRERFLSNRSKASGVAVAAQIHNASLSSRAREH